MAPFSDNMISFPLHKVWQLAGPVLVAHASIEAELVERLPEENIAVRSKTWWKVMDTTRHLLVNPSITITDEVAKIAFVNLRALLHAARVDITSHQKWKFLEKETLASFKEPGSILQEKPFLNTCTINQLHIDFDNITGPHEALLARCRLLFGHTIFRLKATEDDAWMVTAKEFESIATI